MFEKTGKKGGRRDERAPKERAGKETDKLEECSLLILYLIE